MRQGTKCEKVECIICGQTFRRVKGSDAIRCQSCRKIKGLHKAVLNRPYTKDTVFIVCKWYSEGMSIKAIARLLKRSEENITNALKIGGTKL